MKRFIEQQERSQVTLFPERLDDYVNEDNPVRAVDLFVESLHLATLGFEGATPAKTGLPAYHPAVLLKLYIYGYLNRIQFSRRLEREVQRNVELMWLTGRLTPDFKLSVAPTLRTGIVKVVRGAVLGQQVGFGPQVTRFYGYHLVRRLCTHIITAPTWDNKKPCRQGNSVAKGGIYRPLMREVSIG